jgi:hypothetical protein
MAPSQSSIAAALLAFAVGASAPLALSTGRTGQAPTEPAVSEPARQGALPEPSRIPGSAPPSWDDPKPQGDAQASPGQAEAGQVQPERTAGAVTEPASVAVPATSPRKAQARPRYRTKRHCRCKVVRSRRRD